MIGVPVFAASSAAVHDRGELRHADAGDDAGGADRARADADLHRVRAGADQRPASPRAVATLPATIWTALRVLADPLDRGGDVDIVAVRGVDDDQVAFGVDQRLRALEALVADRGRGGDAQPARRVLGRVGIGDRLLDVLDGDQADAAAVLVDDEQFLDPALVEHAARLLLADAGADGDEIVAGHQLGDRLARIFGEADVAVGEDADQPAVLLGDRDAGDPVPRHQLERVGEASGRASS